MTKTEEFEKKQSEMPDKELHDLVSEELSKLCKTGGRSLKMCVPPMVTDTDMLISELLRRFKQMSEAGKQATELIAHLKDQHNFNEVEQEAQDKIMEVFNYQGNW